MANQHGAFIWYELITSDIEAARAFYEPVVGWNVAARSDMPGMDYRMISAPDGMVAGMMQIDDEMAKNGAQPVWLGYIGVDDVDATAAALKWEGGKILIEPRDIPDVGRFAMATDPQGAPIYVMRGFSNEASHAFSADAQGHCAWNELSTPDQKGAHAFYEGLFGWTNPDSMPMGEMGDYRFLFVGDERIGATVEQKDRPALWLFYFRVPSIPAAVEAVKAHGGAIMMGPHEVPGGDHIIIGQDPQGATFALVGGA